jgi:thermostable 8-oxoguanine DNA glycosylase
LIFEMECSFIRFAAGRSHYLLGAISIAKADAWVGWKVKNLATEEIAQIINQVAHRNYGDRPVLVVHQRNVSNLDQHFIQCKGNAGVDRQRHRINGHQLTDRGLLEVS